MPERANVAPAKMRSSLNVPVSSLPVDVIAEKSSVSPATGAASPTQLVGSVMSPPALDFHTAVPANDIVIVPIAAIIMTSIFL